MVLVLCAATVLCNQGRWLGVGVSRHLVCGLGALGVLYDTLEYKEGSIDPNCFPAVLLTLPTGYLCSRVSSMPFLMGEAAVIEAWPSCSPQGARQYSQQCTRQPIPSLA